jgi:hypothetical protein
MLCISRHNKLRWYWYALRSCLSITHYTCIFCVHLASHISSRLRPPPPGVITQGEEGSLIYTLIPVAVHKYPTAGDRQGGGALICAKFLSRELALSLDSTDPAADTRYLPQIPNWVHGNFSCASRRLTAGSERG